MKSQTAMATRTENTKRVSQHSQTSKKEPSKHNQNWMKDWMEQADNYRNSNEVLKLIGNDVDGFLNYADSIEGKYV
jgi:hypothetical protein